MSTGWPLSSVGIVSQLRSWKCDEACCVWLAGCEGDWTNRLVTDLRAKGIPCQRMVFILHGACGFICSWTCINVGNLAGAELLKGTSSSEWM